jgi:predicted MFS family arabinose efflux permease
MTLGGIAGMLASAPAGALVDVTRHKRAVIVAACLAAMLGLLMLWFSRDGHGLVAWSQVITAIAGAVLEPAVAGVTLGMVRQRGFDRQFGRNQVSNHAGNVVGAALSGGLGWYSAWARYSRWPWFSAR